MPRAPPVNARWADWVKEVADRAAANGGREADSYKAAAASIREHPILLVHPSEALPLYKVGSRTVEIISERLKEHCERTGEEYPARREDHVESLQLADQRLC